MASEIWDGAPPNKAADVYALAVVICQLLSGKPPFPANDVEDLRRIQKTESPQFADSVPRHMRDLLSGCLSPDPANRPSTKELASALDRLARGDKRDGAKREGRKEQKKRRRDSGNESAAKERSLALSGLVDLLLREYASASLLARLVTPRVQRLDVAAPLLTLVNGEPGRLHRLAVEYSCGPLSWRSVDTVTTEAVVPREDGRVIVGIELPSAASDRLLDSVAGCVTDLLKRDAHVIALGNAQVLGQLANVAAARHVPMRRDQLLTFSREDLINLVRQWTAALTAQKVCWTWSALTMAAASFERGTAPIDRTMHNAMMLCIAGQQRIVTTWHVSGAVAHGQYLLDASAIRTEWLHKPNPWPPAKLPLGSHAPSVLRDPNMTANADEVET